MRVADLSKEDLAQLAIMMQARMKNGGKGRYTELVESIDKRLSNIERMVAKLATDKGKSNAFNLR